MLFVLSAFFLPALPLVVLIIIWYKFAYAPYKVFSKLGIPHPPVRAFFGNTLQTSTENYRRQWMNSYGSVFGYYTGAKPIMVVTDADILNGIGDKHKNDFANKEFSEFVIKSHGKFWPLQLQQGAGWTRMRNALLPSFNGEKQKTQIPLIERSCDSLMEKLKEVSKGNQSVEVWKIFHAYKMKTNLATICSHSINGEEDEITKAAYGTITPPDKTVIWLDTFTSQLPFLNFILVKCFASRSAYGIQVRKFCNIILEKMKERKMANEKHEDYLQELIDGRTEEVTDEEIASTCLTALIGGHLVSSLCLAYTSYLLALNTDKQDKLCQMIEDYYQENPDTTLYDASQNIPYLDWVVSESLRMYSPVPKTTPLCSKTSKVNGVTIPKDMNVMIAFQELHYSTEYWDKPDVFRPERFSPEEKEGRHPNCFLPFGLGLRTCVGIRLAYSEIKMALVSVLRKYKFHIAPDTEIPLKITAGIAPTPTNGIYLNISSW